MVMTKLRLRIIFADREILSKSQKKDGLRRCWLLLKPHFETISDVASYLLHVFDLHHSCPNGLVLSMDGFNLPPFESTAILKDKALIRVKRKGAKLHDITNALEGTKNFVEDAIVEKQALPSGTKLLANEEFDKEAGGYQSEADEDEDETEENVLTVENVPSRDVACKKRKASSKIENSKAKRQRQLTPESDQKKHVDRCERTPQKKRKHDIGSERGPISKPEITVKGTKKQDPRSDSEECSEPNASRVRTIPVSQMANDSKKVCRGTRRKALKRMFRREQRAKDRMDKCEKQLEVESLNADSGSKKDTSRNIIVHQQADEESDGEGELVPVVIRPGHIRFTPSGKVKDVQQNQETNGWDVQSSKNVLLEDQSAKRNDWDVQTNLVTKDTFEWNGITNKKKGQKWGKEKQPVSSWKESREYNVSSGRSQRDYTSSRPECGQESYEWNGITDKRKGQKWGKEKQPSSWWKQRDYSAHSFGTSAAGNKPPADTRVDFEKLVPLTDSPKAGDIIAYRLLELSPSWCPELSSFRVGKISWFEPESNKIMLVPDPEYPLNLEKKPDEDEDDDDDASGQPPQSSLYSEDGSLEIDFPSLVDVRIVKRGDLSEPGGTKMPAANGIPVTSRSNKRADEMQDGSKDVASAVNNGEIHTPAPANGKKDVWEEISEALSAKKAQLTQEDNWNKKQNSAKRSWSQRTLRTSALGPTMAMLRRENGI